MAQEKVLVIDDNREISTLVSEYILGPAGYQTAVARDGSKVLTKFAPKTPISFYSISKCRVLVAWACWKCCRPNGESLPSC